MTVLGKILVVVNLVFSLIAGALIVFVFATKTNWKAAHDESKRQFLIAEANHKAFEERHRQADQARGKAEGDRKAADEAAQNAARKASADIDGLKQQIAQAVQNAANADRQHRIAATEAAQRQEEVRRLAAIMKERDAQIAELQKQKKELRDLQVSYEIAAKNSQERNNMLAQQLEVMSKELDRSKTGGVLPGSRQENPPAEDVRGLVKNVDAQSGLLTLSLGSDHGLKVGNTLMVYRVKPQPLYLGTIKIVDLNGYESVAKPLDKVRRGLIEAGDTVSSTISR